MNRFLRWLVLVTFLLILVVWTWGWFGFSPAGLRYSNGSRLYIISNTYGYVMWERTDWFDRSSAADGWSMIAVPEEAFYSDSLPRGRESGYRPKLRLPGISYSVESDPKGIVYNYFVKVHLWLPAVLLFPLVAVLWLHTFKSWLQRTDRKGFEVQINSELKDHGSDAHATE